MTAEHDHARSLPANVALVCLSATVSNAAELGSWLGAVRGPTATIVETERPVELQPLYLVGDRNAEEPHLLPVLVDGEGVERGVVVADVGLPGVCHEIPASQESRKNSAGFDGPSCTCRAQAAFRPAAVPRPA